VPPPKRAEDRSKEDLSEEITALFGLFKTNKGSPAEETLPRNEDVAIQESVQSNNTENVREKITRQIKIGENLYEITSDDNEISSMNNEYDKNMCNAFLSLIDESHTIIDVGANVGLLSILFGQHAKNVISFEPSPSTYKYLAQNVEASGLTNILPHNFGLGRQDENLTLTFSPVGRGGAFVSNLTQVDTEAYIVENIQIRNGDSILGNQVVDCIKIDVEGFELNVLNGLSETVRKNKPIVVAELNHWCLNALQRTTVPEYFDKLRDIFPILYAFDGTSGRYLDIHDKNQRFSAMYEHIVQSRFHDVIGAFHPNQIERFAAQYPR